MTQKEVINVIQIILEKYLEGKITGSEMVHRYNDIIVRDAFSEDFDNYFMNALDEFDDDISMYVENPEWRKEHAGYYGNEELKVKAREFFIKISDFISTA
jgi:hypothetical protein